MANDKGPKFSLVPENDPAYQMLGDLIAKHHSDLADARIALVWAHAFKADKDGVTTWGQCRKVSPLDQMFRDHDYTIILNSKVWQDLTPSARVALLDHEICHAGVSFDEEGEPNYYITGHDLEEHTEIVERYGLWRQSVKDLVEAAMRRDALDKRRTEPTPRLEQIA